MKLMLLEQEQDAIRGALEEARERAAALGDRGHDIACAIADAEAILDAHCVSCGQPHVSHERTPEDRLCSECRYAHISEEPF